MRLALQYDGQQYFPRPNKPIPHYLGGMGDLATDQKITSIASTGASTAVGILTALHATIAGLTFTGPVGALISAAIVGVTMVANLIEKEFAGCGQTCIVASQDANKFGDLLLQNLRAYTAAPYDPAIQQAALANFDTVWNALYTACSDPNLGDAGRRCLSDRERGACKWQAKAGGWVSDGKGGYVWTDWGPAGSGTDCWNYFVGFRDPIANDPRSGSYAQLGTPSPTGAGNNIPAPSTIGTGPALPLPLVMAAGAALLLYSLAD